MIYCVDTSSLIFAKNSMPRDLFQGFWHPFEEKIRDRSIISIQPVFDEIGKGDDGLQQWSKEYSFFFQDVTTEIGYAVRDVIRSAKEIVNHRAEKDEADPYIVALALTVGGTVVTQESARFKQGQMKIPLVCRRLDLRCTDLHGMMRELGWMFGDKK